MTTYTSYYRLCVDTINTALSSSDKLYTSIAIHMSMLTKWILPTLFLPYAIDVILTVSIFWFYVYWILGAWIWTALIKHFDAQERLYQNLSSLCR